MVIFHRSPWNIFCFLLWSQRKWLSAKKRAISSRSPIRAQLSSPGSPAIITTHKLARGGEAEENRTKCTHPHLNTGASWRKISSTSGKHTICIPQAGSSPEAVSPTLRAAGQGAAPEFPGWATFPLWQGHCCGSSLGGTDLGINHLIRSSGEREREEGGREEGVCHCWGGFSLFEGPTEGFEQRVSELMGCVTAPAGKAGTPKASRKCL